MRISPETLARLLVCSVVLGVALALLNSIARAMLVLVDGRGLREKEGSAESKAHLKRERLVSGVKAVYTFFVDFLLVFLGVAGIILLCYYLNYGELRGFCFLGAFVGFTVARITLGKAVKILFGEIFLLLRRVVLWIFSLILLPLEIFLNFCKKLFKFFAIKIVNTLAKKRKLLYNKNEEMFIYALAENGFSVLARDGVANASSKTAREQKNG